MASRLIHYLIAERIVASVNINIDRDRFMMGALLPDLSKHEDGSYDRAHFGQKIMEVGIKGINWDEFKVKYLDLMKTDPLYLGYYCHLIMDAMWFSKIVDKYIRVYPYPERQNVYQKNYSDYKKLNYLLAKEYRMHYHMNMVKDIDIEEIDLSLSSQYLTGLQSDITSSDISVMEDLELYPYDVIIEYIENATKLCLDELQAFKLGRQLLSPQMFFTKI